MPRNGDELYDDRVLYPADERPAPTVLDYVILGLALAFGIDTDPAGGNHGMR